MLTAESRVLRRAMYVVCAVLIAGQHALLLVADEPQMVQFGLEGVDIVDKPEEGATYYYPMWDEWPPPAVALEPMLAKGQSDRRILVLRVTVRDPVFSHVEHFGMDVDDAHFDIPLGTAKAELDDSGCHPIVWINFGEQEALVRRLAGARRATVSFGENARPQSYSLTDEDLDRFRRLVKVFDMKEIPKPVVMRLPPSAYKGGKVFDAGTNGITNPELIRSSKVLPRCPRVAVKNRFFGKVVLEARIKKDGTVGDVRVLRAAGGYCGFEEAAIEAVRKWRYHPGKENGQPVDVWFVVVIDYRMP